MDQKLLDNAIRELRAKKQHIDQVILMLETLGTGKPRRGRPPKLLAQTLAAMGASAPEKPVATKRKATRKKRAS